MTELNLEIKELITVARGTFGTEDMLTIVKEYIRLKTGREVPISYRGDVREANMIVYAFDIALEYITKNYKI